MITKTNTYMNTVIIKPKNQMLKKYVQFFMFFKKDNTNILNYTTFPNSNLCLSIYKQNNVNYINNTNECFVTEGKKCFTSKLYGFHKMPYKANINSNIDEVSIIFHPSALSVFTNESYSELLSSDTIFEDVFLTKKVSFLEQIFDEDDFEKKTEILEELLLKKIIKEIPYKLEEALFYVSTSKNEDLCIGILAKKMKMSEASLYRLFKNSLGQSPKSYLNTIRFRNLLAQISTKQVKLDYLDKYYDQSHFIKDFKIFTGYTPKKLLTKVSVEQNSLTWIYDK